MYTNYLTDKRLLLRSASSTQKIFNSKKKKPNHTQPSDINKLSQRKKNNIATKTVR